MASRLGHPKSPDIRRSEEHTSELQSQSNLVCRLLLEKKKSEPNVITESHAGIVTPSRCVLQPFASRTSMLDSMHSHHSVLLCRCRTRTLTFVRFVFAK